MAPFSPRGGVGEHDTRCCMLMALKKYIWICAVYGFAPGVVENGCFARFPFPWKVEKIFRTFKRAFTVLKQICRICGGAFRWRCPSSERDEELVLCRGWCLASPGGGRKEEHGAQRFVCSLCAFFMVGRILV